MSDIKVKGLSDLQKFMDTLAPKLEANVMRGALRSGSKLIMEQAKANVPVGATATENGDWGRSAEKSRLDIAKLRPQVPVQEV